MLVAHIFNLKQKILFLKYKKIMMVYESSLKLWITYFMILNQSIKFKTRLWINVAQPHDNAVNRCAKIAAM